MKRQSRIIVILLTTFAMMGGLLGISTPAFALTYLCQSPSYGYSCVSFTGYSGQSTWSYPVDSRGHNCTNYAAYRLAQNGVSNPGNLGNASQWDDSARQKGYVVDSNPVVGSIAQWESNHVAYVEVVGAGYIEVTDDNWGGTTTRKKYTSGQFDWPSSFIHIKDVGISTTSFSDGTFIKTPTSGTVYVMAGGAPLTVSSWSNVGGSHPVSTVTQAQFDGLRKYPVDGTAVVDNTGTVYIIAGGSATIVTSFGNIPPVSSLTAVDGWAIHNQLLQYPMDGTTVVDTTGTVYVVAGGSATIVSSFGNIPAVTSLPHVDAWSIHNQMRQYPVDGTTVVDTTGTVYVIAGGAAMAVTSFGNIPAVTSLPHVDSWSIHNQMRQYPANGTAVRNYLTGSIYMVAGGAALPITSLGNVPNITWVEVDGYAISTQFLAYPSNGTYVKGYGSGQTFLVSGGATALSSANSSAVIVDDYAIDNVLHATR